MVYSKETVLAEKIETILRRGKYNSRMKDFYDLHLLLSDLKIGDVCSSKDATMNTFTNRKSLEYLKDYKDILESIMNSEKENELWIKYTKKNQYALNTDFKVTITQLKYFLNKIVL